MKLRCPDGRHDKQSGSDWSGYYCDDCGRMWYETDDEYEKVLDAEIHKLENDENDERSRKHAEKLALLRKKEDRLIELQRRSVQPKR